MDHIDEFESMFRRADHDSYEFQEIAIRSVAVVTDGSAEAAEALKTSLLKFLPRLTTVESWVNIVGDDYSNVAELLDRVHQQSLDLIVTYRHLHEKALVPQHSLGVYLDVLTQTTEVPVLVLPGTAASPVSIDDNVCDRVMVVTDHILGDDRLISSGVRMCADSGSIWLCHVEDDVVFDRYMHAIARIPEIDTELARTCLETQLLKEASDFIDSSIAELHEKVPSLTAISSVARGHHLSLYQEMIVANEIDLVVTNTKDEGQMAMHGLAYSLSVELIDTALLLL